MNMNGVCYLFMELAEATAAAEAVVRTFLLSLTWPGEQNKS